MKRLRKKSNTLRSDRAKLDCREYVIMNSPTYMISDNSYSGYVNEDPKNIYIKRLITKEEPPKKYPYTADDFAKEYFEDDDFTFKNTK